MNLHTKMDLTRNQGKTVVREMITRIVMGNHMVTEIHRIIAKKQIFRLQVKMLILIITCLRVHRLTQLHIAHMPMKF